MQTQIFRRPAFASPVPYLPWTSKFKTPLALKDGRTLETLADARGVILSVPSISSVDLVGNMQPN
jgi:hypothetical protein